MNNPDGDALSVRSYEHEGRLVIEAVGEVTIGTQEVLGALLRPSAENAVMPITVDLRQVDFMDSSGLYVLVEASKRLRSQEVKLAPRVVVTPGKQPERVLKTGGFDRILEITHTLGDEGSA